MGSPGFIAPEVVLGDAHTVSQPDVCYKWTGWALVVPPSAAMPTDVVATCSPFSTLALKEVAQPGSGHYFTMWLLLANGL